MNEYREKHLRFIYTVCKNSYKFFEDDGLKAIENALQKIKMKSLEEFGDNEDLSGDEVSNN